MEPYTDIALLRAHAQRCDRAIIHVRNKIAMALGDDSEDTLSLAFDSITTDLFGVHGIEASQSFADILIGENAASVLMLRSIDATDIECVANSVLALIRPFDQAQGG